MRRPSVRQGTALAALLLCLGLLAGCGGSSSSSSGGSERLATAPPEKVIVETADSGFETCDKLTDADRLALQGPVTELAEDLSKLTGTLRIEYGAPSPALPARGRVLDSAD